MTSNIRYKSRIPVKTGERGFLHLFITVVCLLRLSATAASCFCLPGRRSASLHLRLLILILIHPVMANRGQRGGKTRYFTYFVVFVINASLMLGIVLTQAAGPIIPSEILFVRCLLGAVSVAMPSQGGGGGMHL